MCGACSYCLGGELSPPCADSDPMQARARDSPDAPVHPRRRPRAALECVLTASSPSCPKSIIIMPVMELNLTDPWPGISVHTGACPDSTPACSPHAALSSVRAPAAHPLPRQSDLCSSTSLLEGNLICFPGRRCDMFWQEVSTGKALCKQRKHCRSSSRHFVLDGRLRTRCTPQKKQVHSSKKSCESLVEGLEVVGEGG